MEKFKIDLEKLTEDEANEIFMLIGTKFNLVVKTVGVNKLQDVSYIETRGLYDGNFHADEK